MKSIEKALKKYFLKTGPKVSIQEVSIYATKHGDELIDTFLFILNDELDAYTGGKPLTKLLEVFSYLETILANAEEINRNYLIKRLNRLIEKINRIRLERTAVFTNHKKVYKELDVLIEKTEELIEAAEKNDNKQFNFMSYLVKETQNISYVEFTFKKLPHLVNLKDKDGNSLYYIVIMECLKILKEEYDEEKVLYYINLISLIESQQSFKFNNQERKKILDEIYKHLEWMSCNKKLAKKNKEKIKYINIIKDMVKNGNASEKDIESIAAKYNIPIYFSDNITGAVELLPEKIGLDIYPDRIINNDYTVTIDGSDAVEIDDALSCTKTKEGTYLLGVHIASVLGYFPYESEIIEEAFRRNQSIYLRHTYQDGDDGYTRVVPIFPYEFSADKASLKEGEPRLARSFYFEIDKNGNVINQMFSKSIVTSNKKLSYKEANHILKKADCDDEQLQRTLTNLQEVTTILDKKNKISRVYEMMKSSYNPSDLKVSKKGAENIIYQSMLLTGIRVGEFFKKNNYPCLFRVLSLDKETDIRTSEMIDILLEGNEGTNLEKISSLVDSIYPKGSYDTEGRHDGLDLDFYCHCTSSLRRAQDILIEHALEVCYDQEPTFEELEELEDEIEKRKLQINSRNKPIEWFTHEYNRSYVKRRR